MNAKIQRVKKTAANESLVSETSSREVAMVADCRVLQQPDPAGRRLRNHIIVANVVAWIVIIGLIRLIFF
jgi:hypothetical protein